MPTKVYAVFKKLENYYDDNNKTLEGLFYQKEDADELVNDNTWTNYIVEVWEIT